jgi:hypothetical protein
MQQKPEKGLGHQLNVHGYGFQYAVIDVAISCLEKRTSPWVFEVSEFPVETNGVSTHIDFVLRNQKEPFYLVGECKRADPAISNWCFVKVPYISRKIQYGQERVVREVLLYAENKTNPPTVDLDWTNRSNEIYRLAFEVKGDVKGEGKFGRGQINDAITQVMRGQNGLINFFATRMQDSIGLPFGDHGRNLNSVSFIPVIFTTAKLWVSDVNLSEADIATGNIDLSEINLETKDWLLYHYSQTPDILHDYGEFLEISELSDALYLDYTRTIPIVSASGISTFLADALWRCPEDWIRNRR